MDAGVPSQIWTTTPNTYPASQYFKDLGLATNHRVVIRAVMTQFLGLVGTWHCSEEVAQDACMLYQSAWMPEGLAALLILASYCCTS